MFCPKCGNPKVVDVFCATCLREQKPLVASFKEFSVSVCTTCGRVYHHGRWQDNEDPAGTIGRFLKDNIHFSSDVTIKDVEVSEIPLALKSGLKLTGDVTVNVHGHASSKAKPYTEEYVFPYVIQNTLCNRCCKIGTQYFEGTLQVRNETAESKKFFREFLKQTEASVAKAESSGTGTDYFMTKKIFIEQAARELQARFGGNIKSSARLFSRNHQTSKEIYRTTWFIELPLFVQGDAVTDGHSPLLVIHLGKRIKFFNPLRGKHEFWEYKDADWTRLPVLETTIASLRPELTVIDPETFQEVKVANNYTLPHQQGERVKVFSYDNKVYLAEVAKKD